jgi:hypoxanthine phosphoribosyltransferase
MLEDIQEVLLSEKVLQERIRELGAEISINYAGKEIMMIGVLRGAVVFMADLARAINVPVSLDFMAVSSYGCSSKSSGVVRILKDLDDSVEGKWLLIVEDIIDTGLTLKYLLENLWSRKPAGIEICTLLNKPSRRKADVPVNYNGFDIPDAFVVGFGLDYAGKYRNLPFIGVLKPEVYQG